MEQRMMIQISSSYFLTFPILLHVIDHSNLMFVQNYRVLKNTHMLALQSKQTKQYP